MRFALILFLIVPVSAEPLRCTINASGTGLNPNPGAAPPYYDRGAWLQHPAEFRVKPSETLAAPEVQFAIVRDSVPVLLSYLSLGVERPETIVDWPREATSQSFWKDSQLVPLIETRMLPTIDDPAIRAKYAQIMRAELATRPPHWGTMIDNCGHPSSGWKAAKFESVCDLLRQVRAGGFKVVPNMAMAPWVLTDAEVAMLVDSTDGVALETGVHPSIRGNGQGMARLHEVYRSLLTGDRVLILMAVNLALSDTDEREAEAEYTAAVAYMFREPGQRCWVAWPYQAQAPTWQDWPQRLGRPTSPLLIAADGTVSRAFEGGHMTAKGPRDVEIAWRQ